MRENRVFNYRLVLIAIASILCFHAAAQRGFQYKAILDNVPQTGFYTIHLSPAITAACQAHFEDIRIQDKAGNEIPYVVRQQTTASTVTNILPIPLIKTNNRGKIILENSSGISTNELILFIKNAAATRTITLSGSDDMSHWFVVRENIVLAKDNSAINDASFTQVIQFPFNNYRYFQISMQGKDSLPLNIFKAGVYRTTSTINNNYDVIPQPHIIQHDSSDKKSYIRLVFDNTYRIDKLQFSLSGASFFNRSFTLFNNSATDNTVLASGNAISGDSSTVLHLQVKTNALLLIINNSDNVPLSISKLAAYQLPVNLITYLNAGKNYSLFFGNAALKAPVYDLQYFTDSIHASVSALAIKTLVKTSIPTSAKVDSENHLNTWVLWSIIIAVLLLLIYFSFALLKDINRKNTNADAHL